MSEAPTSTIEADIARLESAIRQLKIQYDMFFSGALPKEPFELRTELERLIKRYANAPIRKYVHRFHFNALVSRFNSLSELWTKTLRSMEEGDRPAPAASERLASREEILGTCRIHDPIREQEVLRQMHARFLEARAKADSENGKLTFESFLRSIANHAQRVREKAGCEEVELRLVVRDRKVQLKVRPGR